MNLYQIESEESSIHWADIKVSNRVVLDLGCGRWVNRYGGENKNFDEFSPVFFINKGAKKVIGVDISNDEISFFKEKTYDDQRYEFITQKIHDPEQVKELISKYDVDTIKCDIEGYETIFYEITKEDLGNVTFLAIEYHTKDILDNFLFKFDEWGFEIISHGLLWGDGVGVLFASKKIEE